MVIESSVAEKKAVLDVAEKCVWLRERRQRQEELTVS
jgi:hypothetical protein